MVKGSQDSSASPHKERRSTAAIKDSVFKLVREVDVLVSPQSSQQRSTWQKLYFWSHPSAAERANPSNSGVSRCQLAVSG